VPQRAVAELQGSYQVAIVDDENKARLKSVQVGEQVGHDWLIQSGLAAGDRVVAEGTQKAKEGAAVEPQPYAGDANTNGVAKPKE
jgi:membrane fusion protein (multidrug efflux system)